MDKDRSPQWLVCLSQGSLPLPHFQADIASPGQAEDTHSTQGLHTGCRVPPGRPSDGPMQAGLGVPTSSREDT